MTVIMFTLSVVLVKTERIDVAITVNSERVVKKIYRSIKSALRREIFPFAIKNLGFYKEILLF